MGPVKPGLMEENTQLAARTQGTNPVSESRSASKTGEERGGQKCQRTNSKSWRGDKQLKSLVLTRV